MKTLCIIGLFLFLSLFGTPPQLVAADTLYRDTPYRKFVAGGKKWTSEEDQNPQAKYVGEASNGVPNGQGTIYFPGGDSYIGEFKGGRYDGLGTYIYANGSRKSGEWRAGQFVGKISNLPPKRPDAIFDTSSLFGKENFVFQVPGSSHLEYCVIPRRFPDADYRKKDLSIEQRLCTYDLYPPQGASQETVLVGSCPKNNSSSTGIDFYALPDTFSLDTFRTEICHLRKIKKKKLRVQTGNPKKLAKFKWSSDCVISSSILGYYHLSRFFETGRVPPAVIRTVDRNTHFDFALAGRYFTRNDRLLKKYWNRITHFHLFGQLRGKYIPDEIRLDHLNGLGLIPDKFRADRNNWGIPDTPSENAVLSRWRYNRVRDGILTSDTTQIFGILSENLRGETWYPFGGGGYQEKNRFSNFMQRNRYYKNLTSSIPLTELLESRDLKKTGQMVVGMEDTAGMLILDYLMDQADRIGNIHYFTRYYYPSPGGTIKEMSAKKFEKLRSKDITSLSLEDQSILDNAVPIKEMVLRDNDCGLLNNNKTRRLSALLKVKNSGGTVPPGFSASEWWRNIDLYSSSTLQMKHLNPIVYQRLLQLHDALITATQSTDPNEHARAERAQKYFRDELFMSDDEYRLFHNNLESLVIGLQANCLKGNLILDLDAKNYLAGADTPPVTKDICTSFEPLYF